MFRVLKVAMCLTSVLYNANFRELEELHEVEDGEAIRVSADFVLVDPPYNVQRSRGDKKLEHYQFSMEDMNAMMQLCGAVLKPGDVAICSARRSSLDSGSGSCLRSLKRKRLCTTKGTRVCRRGRLR